MQWIQKLSQNIADQSPLKKIDKFTLYDHNYYSQINEQQKTFTCLLNLKKINRIYHTICQIKGDMNTGQIDISCWLLDQNHFIKGRWQYQRIQLARFAFRYNQSTNRNIFIKVNPDTGEIKVTLAFLAGQLVIEDEQKFKELMTDLCHAIGEQSEMIFNTMLEIIFGIEANEPYLQSVIRNPEFPRYMKIQRLLDKIKALISTSSFYKIRSDISSAHKNRSYFKKIYLPQEKKMIYNHKVIQMALLYQMKFSRKYEECSKKPQNRANHFIKDYVQLEQKNQIQFAKHLNQGYEKELTTPVLSTEPVNNIEHDPSTDLYQLKFGNQIVKATLVKMTPEQHSHQLKMLQIIDKKHPNMSLHIVPSNLPAEAAHWMFYYYEQEMPLLLYLKRNSKTVSISSKLHIMSQLCSLFQYLHKLNIVYFMQPENIFITRGLEVKIRGLRRSYRVEKWVDSKDAKKEEGGVHLIDNIMPEEEFIDFPYLFVKKQDINNEKCDVMSLGVCLYRILFDKFPFFELSRAGKVWTTQQWLTMWTVETEYFLIKGGQLAKILAHLVLKCMELEDISQRPYVEWLLVIFCEVRTSMNGLY